VRRSAVAALVVAVLAGALAAFALLGGAAASDSRSGHPALRAHLLGRKEVPGPGAPRPAEGRAKVRVFPQQERVCFSLSWKHIGAPNAAHIHFGTRTEAGPIVVTFFMTTDDLTGGPTLPETISAVRGCTDLVSIPEGAPFDNATQLLKNINRRPGQYYVNVHNPDFPAGAIRGQLVRSHH